MQIVQVCNYGTPLNAGFTYSVGNAGNVSFTSTSTGVNASTNYLWKTAALPFNGGSVVTTFSNGVNLTQAMYSYTQNGNYLASLTFLDPISSCTAAANQSITITSLTSTLCNLNAFFNVTHGATGATTLINLSSGTSAGTTYLWSFGDATSSTIFSPVHTYSADGVYIATLTANNNTTNTCVATYIFPVKVCSYNPMVASFVYTSNSGGSVTFTSTSIGTNASTYYTWYNLGISSSTFASGTNVTQASVTYSAVNGPANFRLQISDPNTTCANTASQTIVISGSCIANAAFSVTPTNTPQVWTIIPFSPINVIAAVWNWGDGSTSNTLYTTHSYSAAGYYSICLSVTLSCGATHSYCNTSYVFKGEQANEVIYVEVINPATVGIKNNSATASEGFIAPNPNNGIFTLIYSNLSNEVNISLYDLTGRLIHQQKVQAPDNRVVKEFRFTELNNGIYFLRMDSNGKTLTKKIIIEK